MGSRHSGSNVLFPLSISSLAKLSSLEKSPAVSYPSAPITAPVRVARSISFVGLNDY